MKTIRNKTIKSELEEITIEKQGVWLKIHGIWYSVVPDISEQSRYIDGEEYRDKRRKCPQ